MTPPSAPSDGPHSADSGRPADDPFGTGALRAASLAGWRDSPTRLAEDVAAENDLRQIGYRDRWFTELAANAADAASVAGVPGRLRVRAAHEVAGEHPSGAIVAVANTGAALTAAGVAALTALRVSPKAGLHAEVGRFGVGFRATSFVDRVDLLSASGSISFDRARTAAALDPVPTGRAVPAQRLAWPLADRPAPGYDTEVRLHVDDDAQAAALLAQARTEAPDLLLALPALAEIQVGDEVLARRDLTGGRIEIIVRPAGSAVRGGEPGDGGVGDGEVVAAWLEHAEGGQRWLVPVVDGRVRPLTGDVLRAPTPTGIALSLPARLITDLPLTPDRRELHPDADLASAAAGYPGLMARVPDAHKHLLVPSPAFAAGAEDGVLRAAVLRRLAGTAWVPTVSGAALAPERAWLLRGLSVELAGLLGEVAEPLVVPELSDGEAARTLLRLGAREIGPADVADLLSGADRPAAWWARLYAALDPFALGREAAEELGALTVPRADGRPYRGVRGLAVVDLPPGVEVVMDWIPAIDPAAYHPLLERLGLERLSIGDVLNHPALEREVTDAEDLDDLEELADAVLQLLGATGDPPAVPRALGALPVRSLDGDDRPVDELLLPGSPLRSVLYDDAGLGVVDPAVVAAYGEGPLRRLGAGWGFTVVNDELPTAPDHDLDAEEDWWDSLEVPPERLAAVRDLDLVDPARWPAALELLAGDPAVVEQLADPAGYTVWWLRRFAAIDGRPLREYRSPDDPDWRGLFDPLDHPAAVPLAPLLAGAGPDDAEDAAAWLAALGDRNRSVPAGVAARAHAALVAARRDGRLRDDDVEPPARVRTLAGTVADADDAVVIDQPWLLPVVPAARAVLAGVHPEARTAAAFAALLDLPLASESIVAQVVSAGETLDPDSTRAVALAAVTGWDLAGPVVVHEELVVSVFDDEQERRHRVPRWRDGSGTLHVADSVAWTP